ncbi:hypothetical protein H5U35_10310, partial [Candidatus Aerophobetes bacterium]|nr:hypothetical protein [Candidatus Aerophobetes bacterium]
MNHKTLQHELSALTRFFELDQDLIEVLPIKPSTGHIEVDVLPLERKIKISIDENWQITKDHILTLYLAKSLQEHPFFEMGRDLIYHNIAHEQICPSSIEIHHELIDTIAKTTGEKGENPHYICHALEDIICNSWCKLNFGSFKGMILFFYDQLTSHSAERELLERIFFPFFSRKIQDKFYKTFIKVNLQIWAEREDFLLFRKFFSRKKDQIEDKIIKALELEDSVTLEEKVEVLCDRSRWGKFAREFAFVIQQILPEKQQKRHTLSPPMRFEKQIMDIETREKIIKKMYTEKGEKPAYIDSLEITKTIYEMLAPEIPIRVEEKKRGRGMPVVPFNYDPFDPQVHSKQDIDLGQVIVDAESPFFKMI